MWMYAAMITVCWAAYALSFDSDCSISDEQCQPEQIRIAYGVESNDIVVTWTTLKKVDKAEIQFGETGSNMNNVTTGQSTCYVNQGDNTTKQWIHKAVLKNLKFHTKYAYKVGSQYGWSRLYFFSTPPEGTDWKLKFILFGDLGYKQAESVPYIEEDIKEHVYDLVLHVGDFAYDLDDDHGKKADNFLNRIEHIASKVPYMTCPGNHEYRHNYSQYRNRFSMPGNPEKMFYSFNLGPVHFVSINTEVYFNNTAYPSSETEVDKNEILTHYNWLKADLTEANKTENRENHPWIILFGHRPMYCSNAMSSDRCASDFSHRIGNPTIGPYGLESMLKDFGVDLTIWAHEHSYERMWPVFNKTVYNGSFEHPYTNPRAPVHVTSGSAGCLENPDEFIPHGYNFSAFRVSHRGYARVTVYNNTHLYLEQLSVLNVTMKPYTPDYPQVIDYFWLVRDKHTPYVLDSS